MIMNPLGDWLTTREAAELTGYNIQHIRRLARGGKLTTQKWGKDWMVDRSSLLEYLEKEGLGPFPKRRVDNL